MVLLAPPFQPLALHQLFADERAQPLLQFFRIRDHLQQHAKQHGWTFEYLLEEVASMDRPSRLEISRMAACELVLLHAADFGYVHRPRLYWGLRQEHPRTRAAMECTTVQGKSEPLQLVRWLGKPVPDEFVPDDGFEWRHKEAVGLQIPGHSFAPAFPTGRFLTFTTAFPHPADRPPRNAEQDQFVFQRFRDDGRRFPLAHYIKGNLVWKGREARLLQSEEREELMGMPRGYTSSLQAGSHQDRETARLHAIGNSFHVPSVVLVFPLLMGNETSQKLQQDWDISRPPARQRQEWAQAALVASWRPGPDSSRWMGALLIEEALKLFEDDIFVDAAAEVQQAIKAAEMVDPRPLTDFEEYLASVAAPRTATGPGIPGQLHHVVPDRW